MASLLFGIFLPQTGGWKHTTLNTKSRYRNPQAGETGIFASHSRLGKPTTMS